MDHPFDALSRSLGRERSRRGLLKQLGAAVLGAVAASVLPRALRAAVCAPGLTSCGGPCVDILTDPLNCGTCGAAIAPGNTCVNGSQVSRCGPGLRLCGATCTSIASDPANCGDCGVRCTPGAACAGGACRSAPVAAAQPPIVLTIAIPRSPDSEASCLGSPFPGVGGGARNDSCGPNAYCCNTGIPTLGLCTPSTLNSSCGFCDRRQDCFIEVCCNESCVDSRSDTNCGACGSIPGCAGGPCGINCTTDNLQCVEGKCSCTAKSCPNGCCVNNRCVACPACTLCQQNTCVPCEQAGLTCQGGTCVRGCGQGRSCPTGNCCNNGTCVNGAANPNACGIDGSMACVQCSPNQDCVAGQCTCKPNYTLCGANCCPPGIVCANGNCQTCTSDMLCGTDCCNANQYCTGLPDGGFACHNKGLCPGLNTSCNATNPDDPCVVGHLSGGNCFCCGGTCLCRACCV